MRRAIKEATVIRTERQMVGRGRYLRSAWTLAAIVSCSDDALRGQATVSAPRQVTVYAGAPTPPAVTISISPVNAAVQPGGIIRFTVDVRGTRNTSIDWTSAGGSIASDGTFTAGQAMGTFTVKATVRGGTLSGSTPVRVQRYAGNYVDITPGQDIQARINQLPGGTTFRLKAGIHRLSSALILKSNTILTGEPGAVVSGGRLLSNFSRSGNHWVAAGQTQQGRTQGVCRSENPRCANPEDLYINDVKLHHVASLAQVGPGKWVLRLRR